jgi:hypothetical protein
MKLPWLLRKADRPHEHDAVSGSSKLPALVPPPSAGSTDSSTASVSTPRTRPSLSSAAARLDERRVQARFARERYDLYKARAYGPRLTSPSRLGELERECARAEASLNFAEAESAREAD